MFGTVLATDTFLTADFLPSTTASTVRQVGGVQRGGQ